MLKFNIRKKNKKIKTAPGGFIETFYLKNDM